MQNTSTTKGRGLGVGPTRGLHAGLSQRTGNKGFGGGTTKKYTRGSKTSDTKTKEDYEYQWNEYLKERVRVTPKPLIMSSSKNKDQGKQFGESQQEENTELRSSDNVPGSKDDSKGQKTTTLAITALPQDAMSSSLLETSEDEEAQKRREAELAKKKMKGLTAKQLEADINISLCETETIDMLYIPSKVVAGDGDESAAVKEQAEKYKELIENKVGSDSYTQRGSQTMNLTQKNRDNHMVGFTTKEQNEQASYWDIVDAANQKDISEAEEQKLAFDAEVKKCMEQTITKNPNCFFDAEAFATHISIVTDKSMAENKKGANKSGGDGTNSKTGDGSSKMQSSQSALKESTNKSSSDHHSGTSSVTQTNPISSDTITGDFGRIKNNVEYVDVNLPDSMLKAIRIIERLLTQSQYHEQHVLYKNYPPVNLRDKSKQGDEDDEDGKKPGFAIGKKNKKEEKAIEENKEEEENSHDKASLKYLFKFKYDVTEGRPVTCIDINSSNKDLIAVAYGEYDISCTDNDKLKPGLLCFWTLKNPNLPEKVIHTEHSITCCQFSKKSPHLIAIGDSHGNIAIYNIRSPNPTPIAESMDIEGKHSDIVWELKWVEREGKGEALISISGDGRVIEWSMKKGLEFTELMQLKRETNPNQRDVYAGAEVGKKGGGVTFLHTGGLSIDFPKTSKSAISYFVATEDCTIHRCSMSYSETYIGTYYGHQGPIYRIRCNPFWDDTNNEIFLTCSYDWTVRVWNAAGTKESQEALLCHQIESLKQQVNDIDWSPKTSSVFASVANDGRIEIWDLAISKFKPIINHFDKLEGDVNDNTPKTIVRFSESDPVILTGNTKGEVDVYRTFGMEFVEVTQADQIHRLQSSIKKDDFTQNDKNKKKSEEDQD